MKNFIRVDNEWLTNASEGNIFEKIGTEGFTIYCTLLQIKCNRDKFQVTIKEIQNILSRNYEKRPKITYSKKKTNYINVIKDARTIKKYLKLLYEQKLIEIEGDIEKIDEIDKIRITDYIIINVIELEYKKGFTSIACDLILDKIHEIGHIGFSLLYILTNLFNKNFGGENCEGFANPSEQYLSNIIKRDINTVRAYLYLLKEKRLIRILPQSPIYLGTDKNGNEIYQYTPNHYIVNNKLSENKYYIEYKK